MKITVLAENSVCKTGTMNLESENGLSLLIELDERKILFDTGHSDLFVKNAEKSGIDLSQVDCLVISGGHLDCGGIKSFLRINKKAVIFLHVCTADKFYISTFGLIPFYVSFDQKVIAQKIRIYFVDEDTQIDDGIILLEGYPEVVPKPESNKTLFRHEIVMLLIENDEVVLFSGCSDSGIINIIKEVKIFSKDMRIKAISGGIHLLIKGLMGDKIHTMYTGQVFEI